MFTVDDRERTRDTVIAWARADDRVVAAAAVGGSAGPADRWSDLDLTFGIAGDVPVEDVLADWTARMATEFAAAVLFDLPAGPTIYRVFLLPDMLQVDLSFTPASAFGATGPRFRLLFGEAVERPFAQPVSPDHRAGLAVHHAVRAHICLQRGRLWQAEYWIHTLRDEVLSLACQRRDLPAGHGRGYDALPPDLLRRMETAVTPSMTAGALREALAGAVAGLLAEGESLLHQRAWLPAELTALSQPDST